MKGVKVSLTEALVLMVWYGWEERKFSFVFFLWGVGGVQLDLFLAG